MCTNLTALLPDPPRVHQCRKCLSLWWHLRSHSSSSSPLTCSSFERPSMYTHHYRASLYERAATIMTYWYDEGLLIRGRSCTSTCGPCSKCNQ